ncbi:hypothetical protein WG66_010624 [Moniliophthora roreri]|nr:hypothetical protein WG66_010624 [Moniliophthora roreri]
MGCSSDSERLRRHALILILGCLWSAKMADARSIDRPKASYPSEDRSVFQGYGWLKGINELEDENGMRDLGWANNPSSSPRVPQLPIDSSSMSLKPGLYYIQNRRRYIGSSGEEPPNAQRVIVLPDGVRAPRWLVEKLDDDRYIIKVEEPDGSHASAATVDDKIFVRVEKSEAWYIIPDERGGKDSYVIASADERYKGWVAPEEPEDQTDGDYEKGRIEGIVTERRRYWALHDA